MARTLVNHDVRCATELHTKYDEDRERYGVDDARLGAGSVASQATTAIIGFFSYVLFEKALNIAPVDQEWQATIVFLAATLVVLSIQRCYFSFVGYSIWRANPQWSVLTMRFLSFVTLVMLFIATHFLSDAVTHSWRTWHLSWLEGLAAIVATVLLVFYWVNIYAQAKI